MRRFRALREPKMFETLYVRMRHLTRAGGLKSEVMCAMRKVESVFEEVRNFRKPLMQFPTTRR